VRQGLRRHHAALLAGAAAGAVAARGGARSGDFKEISWDEALDLATEWLGEVRRTDPKKLAFFTGRDQSQSLTGWWAMMYGTPNFAAHGGFCSVNMAAAGMYTFGGSFWEFGDTDWDHTRYFMLFGVAEDHASNPLKMALGKLKKRGVKIVSVNPVRTGYSAIADEWIGIRPGTDGLFVAAIIQELLKTEQIDVDYLVRYTNAPWLVIRAPGAADDGLFARDADGKPLVHDKKTGALTSGLAPTWCRPYRAPSRWPTSARPCRCSSCWPSGSWPMTTRLSGWPSRPALPPPPSAASPPSWRMPRSRKRSRSTSPGPTGSAAATTR